MLTVPNSEKVALAKIQEIINSVVNNKYSDFYKNRFSGLGLDVNFPTSIQEWQSVVPVLERNELVEIPFWERTFVPKSEVQFFRHTSGTSGRKPLITPRKAFGNFADTLLKAGVKRQLSFLYGWYISEKPRRINGAVVMNCFYPESITDFRYIAVLAREFKPNSLLGYPSLMILLAPYFEEVGILKNIRVLELNAERCSLAQRNSLMKLYNNPIIFNQFTSTEAAGVYGGPCTKTLAKSSLDFHLNDNYLFTEFIDPDTKKPADPRTQVCETLVTTIVPDQPLPLVRYRTGDLLSASKSECVCEQGGYLFTSEGRANSDRVKFLDGVIAVGQLERAMAKFGDELEETYQAHYFEEQCEDGILRSRVEVHVSPKTDSLDLDKLAQQIAQNFMISAILSYEEAVEHGFLLPLKLVSLKSAIIGHKPHRLIRHTP